MAFFVPAECIAYFSKRWITNSRRYFVFYRILRMRAYGGHDRIEAPDNDQDGQDAQGVHNGQDQDEQNENLPKSRSRKMRCHITVESPEDQPLQKRPRIKMEPSEIYGEEEHYRWIKWKMDNVPEENLEEPEDQPLQKRPRIKMESSEIYGEEEHYRWIKWKMDNVPEENLEEPEDQPLQKRPRIKMKSSEIYGEEEHYRWIKWKMDNVPEENLEEPEDVNEFENPEDQDFEEEQGDPIPEEPKNVEELEEMEREEDNRPPSPFEGVEIGVDVEIHLNNPVQFTEPFEFKIFNNSQHRIAFMVGFNNPAFLNTPNEMGCWNIGGIAEIRIQFTCDSSKLGDDKMFLKFVIFDGKLEEDISDSFRDESNIWINTVKVLFSE